MSKIPLYNFQFLLFASFLLFSMPFLGSFQSPSSELEILLSIKEQWGNQPAFDSWDATTSPCHWSGIQCAGDGTVTEMILPNQSIKGIIPRSCCDLRNLTILDLSNNYLEGGFPIVLYNCTKLKVLNLPQNLFVGQLPYDINELAPTLQHLNLSYNNFTGDIPSSIGQLKRLVTLSLQCNLFNGTFPPELGDLGNLEVLAFAVNPFSPMTLPTEFGQLKSIKFLWMTQCNLIGEIPKSFGNLDSLEQLDLSENSLEVEIPTGLFLLKNLRILYLYSNRLSGGMPASIGASNLEEIDLSNNNLSGPIPQGIGSLQKLKLLSLFKNQFNGNLPPSIGIIPTLERLKVWSNNFTGPLPTELGLHSRLKLFEVSDNYFTGQLPEHLCSGGALLGVVAFNNRLDGPIPKSLGQCNSLRVVMLNNNAFTGEIPQGLWSLQNISVLRLSNNQISGQLPHRLARSMKHVEINNNRFSGEITPSFGHWDGLVVLEASNNLISGTIPIELTSLTRLAALRLDGNQLSGGIPLRIISWKNLCALDLSRNQLSGAITPALASLPVLNYVDLSNNRLSGQISPKLGSLRLVFLNLSSNRIWGPLPHEYENAAYQTSFLDTSLCSETEALDLPRCPTHHIFPSKFLVPMIIGVGLVAFLIALYFGWCIIRRQLKRENTRVLSSSEMTTFHKLDFNEKDILANLTDTNQISSGGSGKIYRIPVNGPGRAVAVKKILMRDIRTSTEELMIKQFQAEVQTLGIIRHCNIVKLLCCISTEDSKLLVYEYMENQSLDKWIREGKQGSLSSLGSSANPMVLDWPTRLRVAVGAAQGLSFMHHDYALPIIHRDIKSSNILLDSNFNAKIGDFGLAKFFIKSGEEPQTVTYIVGTHGYMDPDYVNKVKVGRWTDVYSFGVVLLELVTGKEPQRGNDWLSLAQWAWKHYQEGHNIAEALDKKVKEPHYLKEMTNVLKIGLLCIQPLPTARPSMKEVLQMLQECNTSEVSAPSLGSWENDKEAIEEDVNVSREIDKSTA